MSIAVGVIFVWTGTNASIPVGWERETTLDSKYPKGTAFNVNPGDTGGTATHTHTSDSHYHTMLSHTHTITIPSSNGTNSANNCDSGTSVAASSHTHSPYASGIPSSVSVGTTAVTYASVANDPPYAKVIFIKPTGVAAGLADNGVCFVDTSDTVGFTFCNGSNSTPDLRGKYLKGAGTGADSDVTTSLGSSTNVHTIDHAHTVSHVHVSATSGGATAGGTTADNEFAISYNHTHAVSLASDATATGTTSVSLTTAETVEPAYRKLIPVQNKTGNALEAVGMVGMWLGTTSSIPTGWSELPMMREKHLKCVTTTAEVYDSGGANTHTHVAQNHAHSNISHSHTHAALSHGAGNRVGNGATMYPDDETVTHAASTSSSDNYSLDNGATSADSSSNEPAYKTVLFIKLTSIVSGGAFVFNMM